MVGHPGELVAPRRVSGAPTARGTSSCLRTPVPHGFQHALHGTLKAALFHCTQLLPDIDGTLNSIQPVDHNATSGEEGVDFASDGELYLDTRDIFESTSDGD